MAHANARSGVLGLTLLAVSTAVPAITIATNELPADIQSCVTSGECIFEPGGASSISDYGGASLFQYLAMQGGGVTSRFLVRYTLTDAYQAADDVVTSSSGHIWLGGDMQYNAADSLHEFTLYLDQVSPVPSDLAAPYSPGSPIHLGLNSMDLISGGAFWSIQADESDGFTIHESGTLVTDGVLAESSLCLAGLCGADAFFRLVFLQYQVSGATLDLLPFLNAADTRSVLYQQRIYYDDGTGGSWTSYEEQVHSVQPVPLPGAFLLFVPGLLGLFGIARISGMKY